MYCLHSAASPHLNRHPSPQHQHHHHHVDCHPPIAHHHHQHQIYHSSDRPAKIIEQNTNSHIWIVNTAPNSSSNIKSPWRQQGHLLIVGQESKLNAINSGAITITQEDSCNHKKTAAQNPITGFWQSQVSAQTHKQQSKQKYHLNARVSEHLQFCILNH